MLKIWVTTTDLHCTTSVFFNISGQFNCKLLTKIRTNDYCAAVSVFYMFPLICSEMNLLLIAIDRYIALVHAVKYDELLSVKRIKVLIGTVWIVSAGAALVNMFWNNPREDGVLPCNGKAIAPLYFHLVLGPLFWVSATLMLILYYRIYRFLHVHQQKRKEMTGKVSSRDKNVTKMLFITVVVFLICWTPFTVCVHLTLASKIKLQIVFVPLFLAFANSGINFFIYGARCEDYKTAFSKMMPCLYAKRRKESRERLTSIALS